MNWKNYFFVKITRPCNTWPYLDNLRVKLLVPVKLMDSEKKREQHPFEIEPGTKLSLTRVRNPFEYTDPWMLTEGMVIGASERWWKALVESGRAEIVEN